jgi:hypothetical protein
MRIVSPADAEDQVWIEAYPRFEEDAAHFERAELILTKNNMKPYALQIHASDGQNRTVYQFHDVQRNDARLLGEDHFRWPTPPGWKRIVEEPPDPKG